MPDRKRVAAPSGALEPLASAQQRPAGRLRSQHQLGSASLLIRRRQTALQW